MSTKVSKDLHLTRPSTRVHVAPGGNTTISFGEDPPKAPAPTKSAQAPPPAHVEESKEVAEVTSQLEAASITETSLYSVAVVIGGAVGAEAITKATTKYFQQNGIDPAGIVFSVIEEASSLPFLVKRIAKEHSFALIVAVGLLVNESLRNLNQTLVANLMQIGIQNHVPVIPAMIVSDSLLEIKALLPSHATTWAKSALALLNPSVHFNAAPELPPSTSKADQFTPDCQAPDVLLDAFRESLKARGASGIFGLGRKFRIADDDRSGFIDLAEFTKVISEHAFNWSASQIKTMFDSFDKDHSNSICFDEFLVGVRGPMNSRREQLVLSAFQILDADKSGVVEINDIAAKYDASKHPDVIAGKRTAQSVLTEFMNTFDLNRDGKVTPREFCDYYENVSSSIDEDDYFELMIRNAWHISGGEGWCANSSCRRVLVTHADGRQTVEEIKDDIGMKADDKAAMMANLVAQGISDISSIDTTGNPDGDKPAAATPTLAQAAAQAKAGQVAGMSSQDTSANRAPAHRRVPGGASSLVLG